MAGQHQPQLSAGVFDSNHVAMQVGSHLVGKIGHIAADNLLHGSLIARGARSLENLLQKVVADFVHKWIAAQGGGVLNREQCLAYRCRASTGKGEEAFIG